jgi:hypothetical protein
LVERTSAPGLDLLRGEARSPSYDAVHTRAVLFVAGEYWLIEDRLAADRPHRYDLRFHLAAEAQDAVAVAGTVVRAPGLALVLDPVLDVRIEAGWVAPRYGLKQAAPVVSAASEGSAAARFVTLVAPGERAPGLAVRGSVVEVHGVGAGGAATDSFVLGERGLPQWKRS